MTDEPIAPNPVHPETNVFGQPVPPQPAVQPSGLAPPPPRPEAPKPSFFAPKPAVPVVPEEPKIDHLEEIAVLVRSLHNISPSGAQTVGGQILEHLSVLQVEADKTKAKV